MTAIAVRLMTMAAAVFCEGGPHQPLLCREDGATASKQRQLH